MRLKSEHISMNEAIELGSLEIRKLFKDLNSTALDKKVNMDYLEKELGLRKFFPQSLINSYKVCYFIFKKVNFKFCFFF
jgi:focal adhesion kinase 1